MTTFAVFALFAVAFAILKGFCALEALESFAANALFASYTASAAFSAFAVFTRRRSGCPQGAGLEFQWAPASLTTVPTTGLVALASCGRRRNH